MENNSPLAVLGKTWSVFDGVPNLGFMAKNACLGR